MHLIDYASLVKEIEEYYYMYSSTELYLKILYRLQYNGSRAGYERFFLHIPQGLGIHFKKADCCWLKTDATSHKIKDAGAKFYHVCRTVLVLKTFNFDPVFNYQSQPIDVS